MGPTRSLQRASHCVKLEVSQTPVTLWNWAEASRRLARLPVAYHRHHGLAERISSPTSLFKAQNVLFTLVTVSKSWTTGTRIGYTDLRCVVELRVQWAVTLGSAFGILNELFQVNDRTEQLLTFPTTCVAVIQPGEQPMKLTQNVLTQTLNETKLRLYRDQVSASRHEMRLRNVTQFCISGLRLPQAS